MRTTASRHPAGTTSAALLACALLALAGCTNRETSAVSSVIPATSPTALAGLPREIHRVDVRIADGAFQADRYDLQQGATRLVVTARGGPYTLAVEDLMQAQLVPADATTELHFTVVNPGEYTLKITDGGQDTAVLNVRPVGSV